MKTSQILFLLLHLIQSSKCVILMISNFTSRNTCSFWFSGNVLTKRQITCVQNMHNVGKD